MVTVISEEPMLMQRSIVYGTGSSPAKIAQYQAVLSIIQTNKEGAKLLEQLVSNATALNPVARKPDATFGRLGIVFLAELQIPSYDATQNVLGFPINYLESPQKVIKVHPKSGAKSLELLTNEEKVVESLQMALSTQNELIRGNKLVDSYCISSDQARAGSRYVEADNLARPSTQKPVRRLPSDTHEQLRILKESQRPFWSRITNALGSTYVSIDDKSSMQNIINGVLLDNGCNVLSNDDAVAKVKEVFRAHDIKTDKFSNADIKAMVVNLRQQNQIALSAK